MTSTPRYLPHRIQDVGGRRARLDEPLDPGVDEPLEPRPDETTIKRIVNLSLSFSLQVSHTLRKALQDANRILSHCITCGGHRKTPALPVELQLRILKFAVSSPYPIFDPLYKKHKEHLTAEEARGNCIAIHFLQTCKAYHAEGTKYLWQNNKFIFTQPEALNNFIKLDRKIRDKFEDVTLRIVGRYYECTDNVVISKQFVSEGDLRELHIRTIERPPLASELEPGESHLQGHCWHQLRDFLMALGDEDNRLVFPQLRFLRIDLVNFVGEVQFPWQLGQGFPRWINRHNAVSRHLDSLLVTGLPGFYTESPNGAAGYCASIELQEAIKDGGTYGEATAILVQNTDRVLEPIKLRGPGPILWGIFQGRPELPYENDKETMKRRVYACEHVSVLRQLQPSLTDERRVWTELLRTYPTTCAHLVKVFSANRSPRRREKVLRTLFSHDCATMKSGNWPYGQPRDE